MIELNEKMREYITTEYEKTEFSDGASLAELEKGIETIYETHKTQGVAKVRALTFEYVLKNAEIAVNENDFFADKINHGNLLRNLRKRYLQDADNLLRKSGSGYFGDRESSAYFSGLDFGHICPDWERLFTLGLSGILCEAKEKYSVAETEKKEFYENVICVYSAVCELIRRYVERLKKKGGENCLRLAKVMENLCVSAPKSLYEVIELTLLYYNLENNLECHYVRTLGKLDQLWKPYYENDLKNGYREEELDALISAFFLRLQAMKIVANLPFCVGGLDKKGNFAYSDFSFKLIKIYASLDIFSPKIHIKYDESLPEEFLQFVCKEIIRGNSSYLFVGDKRVRNGLKRFGFKDCEIADYEILGCYEPYASRIELTSTCNGIVSLPKNLELALNDGYDPVTRRQIGPHTGKAREFLSFEDFIEAYKRQLAESCENAIRYIRWYEEHYPIMTSSPLLSATFVSSMESGKDVYYGGIRANSGLNVIGLATAIDSLTCIKHFVFDEKTVTLDELNDALLKNWTGQERLRLQMKKYPEKFGNNLPEPDGYATDIIEFMSEQINGKPNGRNGIVRMGLFSVDNYMKFAKNLGATADGRKAGEFMSKNTCASEGQDMRGLTAQMHSVLKIDSEKCANGTVFDFIVHPSVVNGADGWKALLGLIRTYLNSGGFAIHGNVFDRSTLEKAKNNPEKYRSLQVRVCGWNAYFVDLTPAEQDVFIRSAKG